MHPKISEMSQTTFLTTPWVTFFLMAPKFFLGLRQFLDLFLAFRNFPQALAEKCNSCSRCDCRRWKDCTKGGLFSCRTHWVILSFKEYQQSAKSCDLPKYGRSENSDPCNGFEHIIITQKKMVAESFSGLQLVEKHAQDPCFLAKKCTKFKIWTLRPRVRKKSFGAVFVYL